MSTGTLVSDHCANFAIIDSIVDLRDGATASIVLFRISWNTSGFLLLLQLFLEFRVLWTCFIGLVADGDVLISTDSDVKDTINGVGDGGCTAVCVQHERRR